MSLTKLIWYFHERKKMYLGSSTKPLVPEALRPAPRRPPIIASNHELLLTKLSVMNDKNLTVPFMFPRNGKYWYT